MAAVMTPRRIGAVIRRLRTRRGLTQDQLAARSGLTQSGLSKLEAGERPNPGMTTLKKLAKALDVPVGELLA